MKTKSHLWLCLLAAGLGFVPTGAAQAPVRSVAFDLDGDRDGVVTVEELTAVLLERWSRADRDGDGQVSAEEFAAARAAVSGAQATHAELPAMLPGDDDEDGVLTRAEMERVITSMAQRFDADGDGKFSPEELSYGMLALRGSLLGPATRR